MDWAVVVVGQRWRFEWPGAATLGRFFEDQPLTGCVACRAAEPITAVDPKSSAQTVFAQFFAGSGRI